MTIEELKNRKKELHLTNEQVASISGVPLGTVQKIFSGATKYPRLETYKALEHALAIRMEVEEETAKYGEVLHKRQGNYTLEDYRALPDWPRYELIDGELIIMEAPTTKHQRILQRLSMVFGTEVLKHPECEVFFAPVDVQINCDDKNNLQPDLLVVCDKDKVHEDCIYGAPDFVLEVTSPSSTHKDMVIKLDKYRSAGVREYWVVDPKKRVVITYLFEDPIKCGIYGFDSRIPVGICDGYSVDLAEIAKGIG